MTLPIDRSDALYFPKRACDHVGPGFLTDTRMSLRVVPHETKGTKPEGRSNPCARRLCGFLVITASHSARRIFSRELRGEKRDPRVFARVCCTLERESHTNSASFRERETDKGSGSCFNTTGLGRTHEYKSAKLTNKQTRGRTFALVRSTTRSDDGKLPRVRRKDADSEDTH